MAGSQGNSDYGAMERSILKMDQFEFVFELEFQFDPSIKFTMLNCSEGSPVLPMLTGAPLEARTGSALCCAKASPSSKFKPAEKPNSWFAAGFLSLYVAVYLAAGFVGVAAIEWVWTKLFA